MQITSRLKITKETEWAVKRLTHKLLCHITLAGQKTRAENQATVYHRKVAHSALARGRLNKSWKLSHKISFTLWSEPEAVCRASSDLSPLQLLVKPGVCTGMLLCGTLLSPLPRASLTSSVLSGAWERDRWNWLWCHRRVTPWWEWIGVEF